MKELVASVFASLLGLTPAYSRTYEVPPAGVCTKVAGAVWECPGGAGDANGLPETFTFTRAGDEIALDFHSCKGRKMKHAFHFHDQSCGLNFAEPGNRNLLLLMSVQGCSVYFECSAATVKK